MYYGPYSQLMKDTLVACVVYACFAVVLVVAVSAAVSERRERRRLERDMAVAQQMPPLRKEWIREPPPDRGPLRLWLLPLVAILVGLIVTAWSIWNVLP
jgi:H+/Cl- antiporter ClcA